MNFDNRYGESALQLLGASRSRQRSGEDHPVLNKVELRPADKEALLEYVNSTDIGEGLNLTLSEKNST